MAGLRLDSVLMGPVWGEHVLLFPAALEESLLEKSQNLGKTENNQVRQMSSQLPEFSFFHFTIHHIAGRRQLGQGISGQSTTLS